MTEPLHFVANDNAPAPAIGGRATIQIGYFMQPCTIVAVSKSGHKVTLREDKLVKVGMAGVTEIMEPQEDPTGELVNAHRGRDGRYKADGSLVRIGEWRAAR